MLDLESMVKDELETTYGIEEVIEEATQNVVASMVTWWVNNHDLKDWVAEAVEQKITKSEVSDAVEFAIESFVDEI